jgi:hypothetical protein
MGLDVYFDKVKKQTVGYFRKTNFLVGFFEDYYGAEIENCRPLSIEKEDIIELKSRCKEVLEDPDKADELLPLKEGPLFGTTEYGDKYYKDVEEVMNWCDEVLPIFDDLRSGETIQFEIWY